MVIKSVVQDNIRIGIKDLCRQLTHKMIWVPKNRPPETPWLLQSSTAACVQSGGCKDIVDVYTIGGESRGYRYTSLVISIYRAAFPTVFESWERFD